MSYLQIAAAEIHWWHGASALAQWHSSLRALHQLICSAPPRKINKILAKKNICLRQLTKSTHQNPQNSRFLTHDLFQITECETLFLKKYAQHQMAILMIVTSLHLPSAKHHHTEKQILSKSTGAYFTENLKTVGSFFQNLKQQFT